jgi:hypothetical protein
LYGCAGREEREEDQRRGKIYVVDAVKVKAGAEGGQLARDVTGSEREGRQPVGQWQRPAGPMGPIWTSLWDG